MREVICAYCSKVFTTEHYRKITCSEDCGYFRMLEYNAKRYRETLTRERSCKICGVVFSATDSRRVLCSQACVDINQRNHTLARVATKNKAKKKTDIKPCKYCSTPIVGNSRKKFCNDHCGYLAKLTPAGALLAEQKGKLEEQRHCKHCNALFVWTGRRNQVTHCSDECAYETKKQLHKEYAAKKRRERTPEEHAAFLAHRREWKEKYRARKSAIPDYMNC